MWNIWEKFKLNKQLQERTRAPIFNIGEIPDNQDIRQLGDKFLQGAIYIHHKYPLYEVNGPTDDHLWNADPFHDRSWRFWVQALVAVEHLIHIYNHTHDERLLDRAWELITDWETHHVPESSNTMAWHDHSTALRLIVFCRFFECWRETRWKRSVVKRLTTLVKLHAHTLMNPDFYMEKHNHGLDQDIALWMAARVFDFVPEAREWADVAVERFWKQIDHLYGADGSYMEHSPAYGLEFWRRLNGFYSFLEWENSSERKRLAEVLNKITTYLVHIIHPDGSIPAIGDSENKPVPVSLIERNSAPPSEPLLYVVTKGEKGAPPSETDMLFPQGGYAVFRNKWGTDTESVQCIFHSSFHSRVHKHHDDLAISIFAHGIPIFTDNGLYKYDYESSGRQYVISGRAHNSIVVDDRNTETARLNIGKSGLTAYYSGDAFSFASGVHCLYPGIIHQRCIVYVKPWHCFVFDLVRGYNEHKVEQLFNFHPSISCTKEDQRIHAQLATDKHVYIEPICSSSSINASIVKGQEEPMQGWFSPRYDALRPAWSATYTQNGREVKFGTHINLQPNERVPVQCGWENDAIRLDCGQDTIHIIFGSPYPYVTYNGQLQDVHHIKQATIEQAMDDAVHYEYREKYRAERKRKIRLQEKVDKLASSSS